MDFACIVKSVPQLTEDVVWRIAWRGVAWRGVATQSAGTSAVITAHCISVIASLATHLTAPRGPVRRAGVPVLGFAETKRDLEGRRVMFLFTESLVKPFKLGPMDRRSAILQKSN